MSLTTPSSSSSASSSKPWWSRNKSTATTPTVADYPSSLALPAPAMPLRSHRSLASLQPSPAAASSSSHSHNHGHSHAPTTPKKGIKGALLAMGLKTKRSHADVSLVIQEPPPLPTPISPPPMPRITGRPPAKSVSSTVRSSDPSEPMTPSDGHGGMGNGMDVHRRSFPHSLLTLGDDPFSRHNNMQEFDPSRLSVHSSIKQKIPGIGIPEMPRSSVISASSSNQSHQSQQSYLSSPLSPQTFQSTSDATSPSWTAESFERKPRVRIPSFPATRSPDVATLAKQASPAAMGRRRGMTEGSSVSPIHHKPSLQNLTYSNQSSKEPSPVDTTTTPTITRKTSRPAMRPTMSRTPSSTVGSPVVEDNTWTRAQGRAFASQSASASSSRPTTPPPPSTTSTRPPKLLIRQPSTARLALGPAPPAPPANLPLPPTPLEQRDSHQHAVVGLGLGFNTGTRNSNGNSIGSGIGDGSRLSFASMSSIDSHGEIVDAFAEYANASSPPQRDVPLPLPLSLSVRKDSYAQSQRWMNEEISFARSETGSPHSPAPPTPPPRSKARERDRERDRAAVTAPSSSARTVRKSFSHQNFRRPGAPTQIPLLAPHPASARNTPGGSPATDSSAGHGLASLSIAVPMAVPVTMPVSPSKLQKLSKSQRLNGVRVPPMMAQSASAGQAESSLFGIGKWASSSSSMKAESIKSERGKKSAEKEREREREREQRERDRDLREQDSDKFSISEKVGWPGSGGSSGRRRLFSTGASVTRRTSTQSGRDAYGRENDDTRSVFSLPDSAIDVQTLAPPRPSIRASRDAATAAAAVAVAFRGGNTNQQHQQQQQYRQHNPQKSLALVDALNISPEDENATFTTDSADTSFEIINKPTPVPAPAPPPMLLSPMPELHTPQQILTPADYAALTKQFDEEQERAEQQQQQQQRGKHGHGFGNTHSHPHPPLQAQDYFALRKPNPLPPAAFARARLAGTAPGPLRTTSLMHKGLNTPLSSAGGGNGSRPRTANPSPSTGTPERNDRHDSYSSPVRNSFAQISFEPVIQGLTPPPRRRRPATSTSTTNTGASLPLSALRMHPLRGAADDDYSRNGDTDENDNVVGGGLKSPAFSARLSILDKRVSTFANFTPLSPPPRPRRGTTISRTPSKENATTPPSHSRTSSIPERSERPSEDSLSRKPSFLVIDDPEDSLDQMDPPDDSFLDMSKESFDAGSDGGH